MGRQKKKKDRVAKINSKIAAASKDLAKTNQEAELQRDDKGRFVKGNTESKGLNRKHQKEVQNYIMEKTNDLKQVIDEAYRLLFSDETDVRDKTKLIEVFLNRAIGKPVQMTQIENESGMPTLIFNFQNTEVDVEEWQNSEESER